MYVLSVHTYLPVRTTVLKGIRNYVCYEAYVRYVMLFSTAYLLVLPSLLCYWLIGNPIGNPIGRQTV